MTTAADEFQQIVHGRSLRHSSSNTLTTTTTTVTCTPSVYLIA